jgi:hypothetical protein
MKKSIEDVITKLDNRLEELKDEKTEKIINYLEISPSAKGQFVEYLTRSYIEDSIKNGSYKALKLGRYGAVPLGVLVGSMGAIYAVQGGKLSILDFVAAGLTMYVSSVIALEFARKKRDEYMGNIIMSELNREDIKERILDFYDKLDRSQKAS